MADTTLNDADPAQPSTLGGLIEYAFKKMLQGIDGQLPAQVISYDRKTNRATVQPLITRLTTSGEKLERATIASVPVVALGGGDYCITFPLKAGDRGWIEASDRDISLFLQADEIARPNTLRLHEFADGRFIPDQFGDYELPDGAEEALVIQHKGGDSAVLLKEIEMELRIKNASVTVASDKIILTVGGNTLELSSGGLLHNGKNIGSTHKHGGVESGGAKTDGPE